MKSKALIHLIVAVLLALAAGVMTIKWLGGRQTTDKAKPVEEKVKVVVAAQSLAKGTRLDAGMVRLKPYVKEATPNNAILSVEEIKGRVLSRDISQDDPLTPDKLYPKGYEGSSLEMAVKPGMRALTVKGNKILGAGGLIAPGGRVDVLMTIPDPEDSNLRITKLILAAVPVLATGTDMEVRIGKDGREELSPVDTYTLEVTPNDAEKLALAAVHGTLHFALRQSGDNEIVKTEGADIEKNLSSYRAGDAGPAEPLLLDDEELDLDDEAEEVGEYTVETIRGTEKEQVALEAPAAGNGSAQGAVEAK